MKRYFLFIYNTFYPSGGMEDFVRDFDTIEEIRSSVERYEVDWKDRPMYRCDGICGDNLDIWDIVENKAVELDFSEVDFEVRNDEKGFQLLREDQFKPEDIWHVPFAMNIEDERSATETPLPSWATDHGDGHYTIDIEAYKAQGGELPVELGRIPQFARFFTNPPQGSGSIDFK